MSIVSNLIECFKNGNFTLKEAYKANPDANPESVRARIYEKMGINFIKRGRGLYSTINNDCLLIEGDGRSLKMIEDKSVDCIITDYPWNDKKSTKGGNRNFADYETFNYTLEDFLAKARVLKDGAFLVEILPAESETNYEELYRIKNLAKDAGFQYYAKVTWKKGTFVANTGRKAKNSEDVMIFTKGKARNLRLDVKKTNLTGVKSYMSGTNGMLPTEFNVQAVSKKDQISQSEKPVELIEQILEFVTLEGELVLDQFAGSGSTAAACLKKNRKCIMFEKLKEKCQAIKKRLNMVQLGVPNENIAYFAV